jgi:hypothetical protein
MESLVWAESVSGRNKRGKRLVVRGERIFLRR